MSAAATADAAPAKGGGKKKLMLIVIVVVVLALAGVGALLMMKKKNADADGGDDAAAADDTPAQVDAPKRDLKHPPGFVPLDPFTVNLTDRDVEHYAQIGITLEVEDEHASEELKSFMPAIRSNILLLLSSKSSTDLTGEDGKEKLAKQVKREADKALGIEHDDDEDDADEAKADDGKDKAKDAGADKHRKKKKKHKKPVDESPIKAVHFSNFLIQ